MERRSVVATGYRPALDGVRACAVAAVVAFHVSNEGFRAGFLGVNVFFTLSGFLITLLLLREAQDTGRLRLGAFYMRRLLRLFPALVAVVAGAAAAYILLDRGSMWPKEAGAAIAYVYDFYRALKPGPEQPLTHTWSLAVEEQFYLLWAPFLLLALRSRRSLGTIIAALIVATIALKAAWSMTSRDYMLYFLPLGHADELFIGALLAYAVSSRHVVRVARLTRRPIPVLLGLAAIVAAMAVGPRLHAHVWYLGGFTAVSALAALWIGHLYCHAESAVSRAFAAPPMAWLGRRSYGIYLYHLPIALMVSHEITDAWAAAGLTVAATLGTAALSFRFLETPFLRRKARFAVVAHTEPLPQRVEQAVAL